MYPSIPVACCGEDEDRDGRCTLPLEGFSASDSSAHIDSHDDKQRNHEDRARVILLAVVMNGAH
jgi:hypothetical protein